MHSQHTKQLVGVTCPPTYLPAACISSFVRGVRQLLVMHGAHQRQPGAGLLVVCLRQLRGTMHLQQPGRRTHVYRMVRSRCLPPMRRRTHVYRRVRSRCLPPMRRRGNALSFF